MVNGLVYDVGMHDGSDTAYYLRLGLRVVAIEADPALCDAGRRRFAPAIAAGRLTLLPIAVAERRGSARLWVNPGNRGWNSLAENLAARRDDACQAVEVPALPFADILAEHGVPEYLKSDIEGFDHLCVEAIDPRDRPTFVSVEFSDLSLLDTLVQKGYRRFKCVRQNDLRGIDSLPAPSARPETPVTRWLRQRPDRLRRKLLRVFVSKEASRAKAAQRLPDGGTWRFTGSSSGPIGPLAAGRWLSETELRTLWAPWQQANEAAGDDLEKSRDWFDLHATA